MMEIPKFKKSQTSNNTNTNPKIYFRKNTTHQDMKNTSSIILETYDKKISIKSKKDEDFLNIDKIEDYLKKLKENFARHDRHDLTDLSLKENLNYNDFEINSKSEDTNIKVRDSIEEFGKDDSHSQTESYIKNLPNFTKNSKSNLDFSEIQFKNKTQRITIKSKANINEFNETCRIAQEKNKGNIGDMVMENESQIKFAKYPKNKKCLSEKILTKLKNSSNNNPQPESMTYACYSYSNESIPNLKHINFLECIICETTIHISSIISLTTCIHKICMRCIKVFYEDKLESGEYPLRCPLYQCRIEIDCENVIQKLISPTFWLNYKTKKEDFNSAYKQGNRLALLPAENYPIESPKIYTKRHVLGVPDASNADSFFQYAKFKEIYCQSCSEPALFSKLADNNIKCMNCLRKFCKFCNVEVTDDHFDIEKIACCKVYRRKLSEKKNESNTTPRNKWMIMRKICEYIIRNIFSFFLVLGYMHYLVGANFFKMVKFCFCNKFFQKKNEKVLSPRKQNFLQYLKNAFCYMITFINIVCNIVIYISLFPVCFMIFPFFKLINEIVN